LFGLPLVVSLVVAGAGGVGGAIWWGGHVVGGRPAIWALAGVAFALGAIGLWAVLRHRQNAAVVALLAFSLLAMMAIVPLLNRWYWPVCPEIAIAEKFAAAVPEPVLIGEYGLEHGDAFVFKLNRDVYRIRVKGPKDPDYLQELREFLARPGPLCLFTVAGRQAEAQELLPTLRELDRLPARKGGDIVMLCSP
jgi:hypothetical protein